MPRLILASSSVFRRQLLRDAGFDVETVPPDIVEPDPAAFDNLYAGLIHVAQLKAFAVAERGVHDLIVAADTVGHVAGRVFGKPADRTEAERMLRAISGTAHSVLTGWCLFRPGDRLLISGVEETTIEMRRWTDGEISAYLDSNEWVGKSGAYGLQLPIDPFVTGMEGSAANVVGVPLERLTRLFAEFPSLLAGDRSPAISGR